MILSIYIAKAVPAIFRSKPRRMSLCLLFFLLLLALGHSAFAEPTKVNLTTAERNNLDTFFTNFAEKTFAPFSYEAISDDNLIRFGLTYLAHNKYNSKLFIKISVQELNKVTMLYFNKMAKKHHSIHGWLLNKGIYYKIVLDENLPSLSQTDELWESLNADNAVFQYTTFEEEELPSFSLHDLPNAANLDSEISPKIVFAAKEPPPFSQIDELWDNGNGTFTAIVSVYKQSSGWKGDPHGVPEKWTKQDPQHGPQFKAKYKAIISLDYIGESARYILREYLLDCPVIPKNEDDDLSP